MTPITILQSAADTRPDWVTRCMTSVADWSQRQGYGYHCIADELFDWVTPELRTKLHDRTPILADLARLRWIESELAARGGLVVWIDADTLVVDPDWCVPDSEHTIFGEECWVQPTAEGAWRAYQSPHNAFMGFTAASPVLGFLAYLSESIIERADEAHRVRRAQRQRRVAWHGVHRQRDMEVPTCGVGTCRRAHVLQCRLHLPPCVRRHVGKAHEAQVVGERAGTA